MRQPARGLAILVIAAFALLGGWRVVDSARRNFADGASADVHGPAGHRLGESRSVGDAARAGSTTAAAARRQLAVEPLRGNLFLQLASAADGRATALHRIAVQRSPRDVAARVWLVNDALKSARFVEAMRHVDVLLRLFPHYRTVLYPRLAQFSADPAFARALADRLGRAPMWRDEFVQSLLTADASAPAADLLATLGEQGRLTPEQEARWLDSLLARGRWGEAYARWTAARSLQGAPLPAVYNGEFADPPTGTGFNWRLLEPSGVELDFAPRADGRGAAGTVAHAVFRGRPSPGVNLQHPLLVPPGRYRLVASMRAQALQAEVGLTWSIACNDPAQVLATGVPITGDFEWRAVTLDFEVPSAGCAGQWLRLINPAPPGAAQHLSGEVWIGSVRIISTSGQRGSAVATLHARPGAVLRSRGADFVAAAAGARLEPGSRLLVLSDGGHSDVEVRVVFDDGCSMTLARPGLYSVEGAVCTQAAADPARDAPRARARVTYVPVPLLPEAQAWKPLPIGR